MERQHPNPQVDWSLPENHAEQHVIRYEDALINIAAKDAAGPVDGLTLEERRKFRAVGVFEYRQDFIAAGGSPERADSLIDMGNGMQSDVFNKKFTL